MAVTVKRFSATKAFGRTIKKTVVSHGAVNKARPKKALRPMKQGRSRR